MCWSYSNRSALVRVPLGWINNGKDMSANANPLEKKSNKDFSEKQTFEWRASDGCADMYLLMAALCAAARHGFEMPNALEVAEKTYVGLGVNIHDDKNKKLQESLEQLPDSCVAAAKELEKDREIYTAKGVFSDAIIDYMIKFLTDFNDAHLRKDLGNDTKKILKLVKDNIHVG